MEFLDERKKAPRDARGRGGCRMGLLAVHKKLFLEELLLYVNAQVMISCIPTDKKFH